MNANRKVWRPVLALIAALAFWTAPVAQAQTPAAKEKPAAAKATVPAKAPATAKSASGRADGQQEGIKVHGHWTIEVRNPDGSLAARREFENSLRGGGMNALRGILSRQNSLGIWGVVLGTGNALASAPQPCNPAVSGIVNDLACGIFEADPGTTLNVPFVSFNVNVANASLNLRRNSTPGSGLVELTGTVTALAPTATIDTLWSFLALCSSTGAPATPCTAANGGSFFEFSRSDPGAFTPVTVVRGQIIQVTVSFTFS